MVDRRSTFRHLYLHAPFCLSRCGYCAFYSQTGWTDADLDQWLEGVLLELDQRVTRCSSLDTIYLGGGTPSLLGISRLDRLLTELSRRFSLSPACEITLEANPGSLSSEAPSSLARLGINRLSIGVQSLHDPSLRSLGRRHTAKQAFQLVQAALDAGLRVSVDLLYALPGQSMAQWRRDLHRVVSWGMHHMSCYELTVEPGTPLAQDVHRGTVAMPGEPARVRFFRTTHRTLAELGFPAYEISSFAGMPEWRSRHNQAYWNHSPYLGLGPGAHSLLGRVRQANPADLTEWYSPLATGAVPHRFTETLDDQQVLLEAVMLGLRTAEGLSIAAIQAMSDRPTFSAMTHRAETLEKQGWLARRTDRWVPTLDGWLVADRLPGMLLWATPTENSPRRPSSSARTSR
jgi:oxygen-independent coproporphyrinogen-3 oxidase